MDSLRLVLIVLGIVVIAGIIVWGRRRQAARRDSRVVPEGEAWELNGFAATEDFKPDESWDGTGFSAADAPAVVDEPEPMPSPQGASGLVVAMVVLGRDGLVDGGRVMDAAKATGLHFGRMDIFHYYPDVEGVGGDPWFSMANALEPGTFDIDAIRELKTPGVAFFLQLPGDFDGLAAFDRMLETARTFAGQLGGELFDERRQALGEERLAELRERVRSQEALSAAGEKARA